MPPEYDFYRQYLRYKRGYMELKRSQLGLDIMGQTFQKGDRIWLRRSTERGYAPNSYVYGRLVDFDGNKITLTDCDHLFTSRVRRWNIDLFEDAGMVEPSSEAHWARRRC